MEWTDCIRQPFLPERHDFEDLDAISESGAPNSQQESYVQVDNQPIHDIGDYLAEADVQESQEDFVQHLYGPEHAPNENLPVHQ